jgi:hypothetical protein
MPNGRRLRLLFGSPAINNNTLIPPGVTTDLDGAACIVIL